ncbi:alpha/beta hydrolase [Dactylosporangium aurantiacum]|uniref:Alpha/beta hydrolase n=1 Tax=Dactylosporangium aurantiacum TaxID=35754 RepID=A0A9Q9ICI3_9ACTN|nr:alpha/beta hydrolase [Dactylosporangium aurantiacum]MDG6104966.1 alpha/beta hydrolase [Dactylosporangium aurantiacum]UWZ51502.1 alpha/beta hydrolase [Dactylosporangium aurantiacum]
MIGAVVAASSATVLAAPAAGLLGYRQLRRAANARRLRITNPHGIDESGFARIGGIDQWVSIRGDDRSNPVMLEIHGGPGVSNLPYNPRTRAWERHFTVVRWDMRGAGRTFDRGGPAGQGELTLDRLCRDAVEVTDHIRARLGVAQVVLVANSFGSFVGLRLARNHPERYSAYVGTDQNINAGGRERTAYHALLDRLRTAGKSKELAAVTTIGPDRATWTGAQWSRFHKLVAAADPLTLDTIKTVVLGSLLTSPRHTLRDLRSQPKAMTFSEPLALQSTAIDEWLEGTTFAMPFFIFQGAHDVITPPAAAKRFFDDVSAPVKEFALIADASHFASFRHPDRFLDLMLTKVGPAITRPSSQLATDGRGRPERS